MLEVPKNIVGVANTVLQKAKLVPTAAEEAFFDYDGQSGVADSWEKLVAPGTPQFERTAALFMILRGIVPDAVFKKFTGKRYEHQGGLLPVDPKRFQFESKKVGKGGECLVYKLTSTDPDEPSFVVKIDRFTTEKSVDELVARGKQVRSEYEAVREWYSDIPGLIPEEMQFISRNPRGGGNALLTLQEYYGTADEIHDLFRGQSRDDLIDILDSDSELIETFRKFAHLTLEHAARYGQVIDTLGDKNVVLINRPAGRHEIRILDPHAMKSIHQPENPENSLRIQSDLDFLREVSHTLDVEQ